ncbi:hypothetical protein RPMA_16980 [Tardiphaga alba]|uniref:Uncharacterized protein n=1 Tax=Tardiphaga alba TaxID=340268 RepID=A0ABX8AAL2_9BRAD|nr:hypothetical protein [Tardiphaga alba]QUS40341.1 hypothetical protein RPMA_16980 [Tardiphaga alba]
MRRKGASASELLWIIDDRVRQEFKNTKRATLAVVPDGRHAWTIVIGQRGPQPDVVAFIRKIEAELHQQYFLEE